MLSKDQVYNLSYIVVAENIPSILERGILSHVGAMDVAHTSVANPEVQDRRAAVILPSGRRLHEYANLYFWARNAMMYLLRDKPSLCILKVSPAVIDLDGAYYSTKNSSAAGVEFHPCGGDFEHLERESLYAGSWVTDGVVDDDRRQRMQAELLVPDHIPTRYVTGVFFNSDVQRDRLQPFTGHLDRIVRPGLFFQ